MTADPKKLRALLDSPMASSPSGVGSDYYSAVHEAVEHAGDGEEENHGLHDDMSDEQKIARKVGAGYMEISEPAGGFSCGECRYAAPGAGDGVGSCLHPSVRAEVSETHGCCNLFWPAEAEVIFPSDEMSGSEPHAEPPERPGEGDGDGGEFDVDDDQDERGDEE